MIIFGRVINVYRCLAQMTREFTHPNEAFRTPSVSEPGSFIFFPEGTRSRKGALNSSDLGIGKLVVGQRIPIVPCHIGGAYEALPCHRRFPIPKKISIKFGKASQAEEASTDKKGWVLIAREFQERVQSLAGDR